MPPKRVRNVDEVVPPTPTKKTKRGRRVEEDDKEIESTKDDVSPSPKGPNRRAADVYVYDSALVTPANRKKVISIEEDEDDHPTAEDMAFLDDFEADNSSTVHRRVDVNADKCVFNDISQAHAQREIPKKKQDDALYLQEMNRQQLELKMAVLENQEKDIDEGLYDECKCPVCDNKMQQKTDENGDLNVWCSNRCAIPFIPKTKNKIEEIAKMYKRYDPQFKRTADRPMQCFCKQEAKLILCASKTWKVIDEVYFFVCKKLQNEGPCTYSVCVEVMSPEEEFKQPLVERVYKNRQHKIQKDVFKNLEAARCIFNNTINKTEYKKFDWSDLDAMASRMTPQSGPPPRVMP